MKTVSAAYKEAIYAKNRRTTVTLSIQSDPMSGQDLWTGLEILSGMDTEASIPSQLRDNNWYPSFRVITNAKINPCKLDGSSLIHENTAGGLVSSNQYGIRSVQTNAAGVSPSFNSLSIRITLSKAVYVDAVTFVFDKDMMPKSMYSDYGSYNLDQSDCVVMSPVRKTTNMINISFVDTVEPNASFRLMEITIGNMKIYNSESILTLNLVSESSLSTTAFPNNQLNFSLENYEGLIRLKDWTGNPAFSEGSKCLYRHTVTTNLDSGASETLDMGAYLLASWNITDKQASFTANQDTQALDIIYDGYDLSQHASVGTLLERIFAKAGWTKYVVEPFLYQTGNIFPYFGDTTVTCKEAIMKLAVMSGSCVFLLPDGTVLIRLFEFMTGQQSSITAGKIEDTLTENNMFDTREGTAFPYDVMEFIYPYVDNLANMPYVVHFTGNNQLNSSTSTINITQRVSLTHTLDTVPLVEILGSVANDVGVRNVTFYKETVAGVTRGVVTFQAYKKAVSSASYTFNYTISMKRIQPVMTTQRRTYGWKMPGSRDSIDKFETTALSVVPAPTGHVWNNILQMAIWGRMGLMAYSELITTNWRQNPAHNIGDIVNVKRSFKSGPSSLAVAKKHNLDYSAGYLKGTSEFISKNRSLSVPTE